MRFNALIIQNYKTFRNRTRLDFSRNFNTSGRNVFLIGGMNGSGKTSILDAINLCLYGEKKHDRVFKLINQHEVEKRNYFCSIELQFEMDNGDTIDLARSWDVPSNFRHNATHEDLKETVLIRKNGKTISDVEQQIFLDYIKTEIPSGITQFFFFDGEKIQEMAADEFAASNLKESMEAALGIQHIRKLIDDLETIKRNERREDKGITNADIKDIETDLEKLKNKQLRDEERIQELEGQKDNYRKLLDESKSLFKREFGFDPEEVRQNEQNGKLKSQYERRLSEIDLDIRNTIQDKFLFAFLIPHFQKVRAQIDIEKQMRLNKAIKQVADTLSLEIVNEIKKFEDETRKKPLNDDEIQSLKQKIVAIVNKYKLKKEIPLGALEILNLSDNDAKRVLVKLEEIEKGVSNQFIQLIEEKQRTEVLLETLEKDLRKKTFEGSRLERFNEITTRIQLLSTDIGDHNQEIKQKNEDLKADQTNIREKESELENAYDHLEKSTKKTALLKEISKISKLLNDYIDQLRTAKIHQLETSTFDMFVKLLSKGDSINNLSIDRESYFIKITNDDGHVIRKEELAAGEKEIFAISLLWGLAQTSQLKLPIIIDTPLSRLDSVHRDKIVSNYFPNAGHQVIILSTDTEVDKKYYTILERYLQYAIHLNFSRSEKVTTVQEGYFWRT
jgi:DNA sulfur modification protein DndD